MPPHFTTIPREIRDMILELCLVVGTINPHPTYFESSFPFRDSLDIPDISLLAVNKSIGAEAAEIFYGKNRWVISWSFAAASLAGGFTYAPTNEVWHIHRHQIRHVSLDLDLSDFDYEIQEIEWEEETAQMDPADLAIDACRWKLDICRELGAESVTIRVSGISSFGPLDGLEPMRCCCLDLLLEWVGSIEEARVDEHDPAPVRKYPAITLAGFEDMDQMTAARQIWEEDWGPVEVEVIDEMTIARQVWEDNWRSEEDFVEGGDICLRGLFQPRDPKTLKKA